MSWRGEVHFKIGRINIKIGIESVSYTHLLDQANTLFAVQLSQQAGGFLALAVEQFHHLIHSEEDIDAALSVQPSIP